MLKILGLGDNVVDKYLHMNRMYPGGNALNVAVLAHRYGVQTGYMGCLGNDFPGRHIYDCLVKEGVDVAGVKVVEGTNGYANVTIVDGDRVFLPGDAGVSRQLRLSEEDYSVIGGYDLVHTSVYSGIDAFLAEIKSTGVKIAYDFSDLEDRPLDMDIMKYVDYAFVSASGAGIDQVMRLLTGMCDAGVTYAMATRGSQGAILMHKGDLYEQKAADTEVMDTLGAGDAFIARFLTGVLQGESNEEALKHSAEAAANVCTYYGAFGYGVEIQ